MTSPTPLPITAVPDRLEFRFLWNAAEHQRFYTAVARASGRSRTYWRFIGVMIALIVLAETLALGTSPVSLSRVVSVSAPYVVLIVMWVVFIRWGFPYISARNYARDHRRCIPHDQVRIVSMDGIEARCVTTDVKIRWSGITRVSESAEFFLFFTGPASAFALPKRAVPDAECLGALRGLLVHAFGPDAELLAT